MERDIEKKKGSSDDGDRAKAQKKTGGEACVMGENKETRTMN